MEKTFVETTYENSNYDNVFGYDNCTHVPDPNNRNGGASLLTTRYRNVMKGDDELSFRKRIDGMRLHVAIGQFQQ